MGGRKVIVVCLLPWEKKKTSKTMQNKTKTQLEIARHRSLDVQLTEGIAWSSAQIYTERRTESSVLSLMSRDDKDVIDTPR